MFDGHPTNDTKRGGSQREAQLRDRNRDGMTLLRLQKETHEVEQNSRALSFGILGERQRFFSKLLGPVTSSAVEVVYESHTPKLRMSWLT